MVCFMLNELSRWTASLRLLQTMLPNANTNTFYYVLFLLTFNMVCFMFNELSRWTASMRLFKNRPPNANTNTFHFCLPSFTFSSLFIVMLFSTICFFREFFWSDFYSRVSSMTSVSQVAFSRFVFFGKWHLFLATWWMHFFSFVFECFLFLRFLVLFFRVLFFDLPLPLNDTFFK